MMDFDRKSSNSSDKAQNGCDPLLELTRLFGGKPEDEVSDSDGEVGYKGGGDFPPGEFPAFELACSSQGSLDEYPSYDSVQPAVGEEFGFYGNAPRKGKDGLLTEDDFQTGEYYGAGYNGENSVPCQEPLDSAHYGSGSLNIPDVDSSGINSPENNNEGGYPTENGWYDAAHPYNDEENRLADEAAYSVTDYQEDVQQFQSAEQSTGQEYGQYQTSHEGDGSVENWRQEVSAWEDETAGGLPSMHQNAYDNHSGFQQVLDEGFPGGNGAVFSYESEQESDGQMGYSVDHADNAGWQSAQMRAVSSEMYAPVQNPEDEIFDNGFFRGDIPQETAFEPSDYEMAYNGAAVYEGGEQAEPAAVFNDYREGKVHSCADGNSAVFPRETAEYNTGLPLEDAFACQQAGTVPTQAYFDQAEHSYSYAVQPVVQSQDVYEEEFSYQDTSIGQDAAVYGGYSTEGAEVSVNGDDNGAHGGEAQYQRMTETLHGFDMTDYSDNRQRRQRVSELDSLGLDETGIEETGAFDLPPVDYEDEAVRLRIDNALDEEFADIFETDGQSTYVPPQGSEVFPDTEEEQFFPMHGYASYEQDGVSSEELLSNEEGEDENAVYDWASPASLAAMAPHDAEGKHDRGGHKWLYGAIVLAVIFALGAGIYMFFLSGNMKDGAFAVIHAEQSEIKVKPENTDQTLTTDQEQAVYNRVEGNIPNRIEQEELIDKTEMPVDIHKIDEQPPLSTESGLDQSSVESLVMTAAARSMPIHIVPTVVVSPDRKIVTVSSPGQKASVLVPGGLKRIGDEDNLVTATEDTSRQPASVIETVVPQAQQTQAAKIGDIREPDAVVAGNKPALALQAADSAKEITPPTVIPDKPRMPVQVASNNARQREFTQPQVHNVDDDNGFMGPNDFYMQISSQPSKEAAQHSAEEAKQHFGSIIGNNSIVVVPAVIPDRGTYYRVRVPVGERNAALRMCEQYKQAGGSCFIGR